jgi:hypothetical protein
MTFQFDVSPHALERAAHMGVNGEAIREAMLNPRFVANTTNGREMRTRGKVALVVTKEVRPTIVTVMWATAAAWAEDMDGIPSREGGRDQKHMQALRRAKRSQKRKVRGRGY